MGATPCEFSHLLIIFERGLDIIKKRTISWTKRDILCLILIRMRLYLPFRILSSLCNSSTSTVWRIINQGIKILGNIAASHLRFPPQNVRLKRSKFLSFQDGHQFFHKLISWLIDGWNQTIYESQDPDIKKGTFSNQIGNHCVKKLIITDPSGFPYYVSPSFVGRPHDMNVCKFPELDAIFKFIEKETKETGEYGLGDNAFSGLCGQMITNFLFTPREDSQENMIKANQFATIRHAVENINAELENFNAMNDQIRMSPSNSMRNLLYFHHLMSCLCIFIVRELIYK